jgi:hypothetical protein
MQASLNTQENVLELFLTDLKHDVRLEIFEYLGEVR